MMEGGGVQRSGSSSGGPAERLGIYPDTALRTLDRVVSPAELPAAGGLYATLHRHDVSSFDEIDAQAPPRTKAP